MPPRLHFGAGALKQVVPRWKGSFNARLLPCVTQSAAQCFPPPCLNANRNLAQASILRKKGGGGKAAKKEESSSSAEKSSAAVAVEDPYDFSALEAGIQRALGKLQDDLAKLRTGGRFNPELLEGVRVQLKKDSKMNVRLGDLAQVIPKGGKSIVVLVGEADHLKPITSAIQGSKDLNLQPRPDPHNALQLNIPIPAPTRESRDLALGAVAKAGEVAGTGIRNARAAMQKRLRAMELNRAARPDDIRKAHKEMEKVVEKGNAEAKKAAEAAKRVMES